MNILIVNPKGRITVYNKGHVAAIKKILPGAKVNLTNDLTEISNLLKTAEIIITSPVGFDLDLTKAKELKWLHSSSAGVTDLARQLKNSSVILTNSSGVHPIPIAEHVFGLILMFSRRLYKAYRFQIEKKEWLRDTETLDGVELAGQTLGIVGYGRIGERIAKLAKGFDMKVIALEHNSKIENPNVDKVSKNIEEILKNADFIVNCLPLTTETFGYFDRNKFKQMKKSAFFVNIGRGKTVVEKDLISALKNKTIAAAGLDVFEEEPLPKNSPLWKLGNVIISPHFSGWTPKYTDRVIEIFCENLKAFQQNRPMPNLVDKIKGY